jgi:hypothetical protein
MREHIPWTRGKGFLGAKIIIGIIGISEPYRILAKKNISKSHNDQIRKISSSGEISRRFSSMIRIMRIRRIILSNRTKIIDLKLERLIGLTLLGLMRSESDRSTLQVLTSGHTSKPE